MTTSLHKNDSKTTDRIGDGAKLIEINPSQINAETTGILVADKEAERKLKKKERSRAYYLANIDRLRKKARGAYRKRREEMGKAGEANGISPISSPENLSEKIEKAERFNLKNVGWSVPTAIALLVFAAAVLALTSKTKEQLLSMSPAPKYRKLDIGNGKIIEYPIAVHP